ncbi:carbohydrate ABC transporter membrane protein 1 (CUT1 family) [Microterricola gilva]|uniref:Carbohydrate ABC transporter membrane protein 1 (CUT1 family) n=1 Tax=Microterricola gilva TaxID=393267 RepID=A0A4Q8AI49_9MICO|nr:sugar ABC transporter permease [Microterricola gilva]RZU64034.1 carbohydrate ABC transporter membrane protein 1 (CUT1 family) [Microterricola gilva]
MNTQTKRRKPVRPLHFLTFALPGAALYAVFVLWPLLVAFGSSLTNEDAYRAVTSFVWFENYVRLFSDPAYLQTLSNTVILTIICAVVPNAVGLGIAILLDRTGWVFNALRAVFFVPVILSSVVVAVVWQQLLKDDGLVNSALRAFTSDPPGWLSDPNLALYSVAAIVAWQSVGVCVVLYLAGLQSIPKELLEAAAIDGAGPARRFWTVTWPLLAPSVTIMTVLSLIGGFKIYDQVKVMTNGGPGVGTTSTLAFDVVQTGLDSGEVGYSAAKAAVMFIIIAAVSMLSIRQMRKREVDL